MTERNRLIELSVVTIALSAVATGWISGYSLFGFRTPFWDLGLIPTLAALVVGSFHLNGPHRRFLIGFEICGVFATLGYLVSCSGPARWSMISAMLPFQTGFWLDPEMKTSRITPSPWKIALDAVFVALLPSVPALIGGRLLSARITLRRAMTLIAVVAVVLAGSSAYLRRVRYYDNMGQHHRGQIVGILAGNIGKDGRMTFIPSDTDPSGKPLSDTQRRMDAWHGAMSQQYWGAACYPWITVKEERPPE